MDPDFITQLLALAKAHSWVALAALVIGLLVRLVRDDSTVAWFPITIPSRWRPLIALGLGIVSGILNALVAKVDWPAAIVGGVVSAVTAMGGHAIVINALRNGRELGEKKTEAKAPGSGKPGSGGSLAASALVFCFVLVAPTSLPGCAAVPTLVAIADAVAISAPYAAQVVDDVDHALAAYFTAHPDATKQAAIQGKLEAAKLAALGLGKLAETGKEVSEKDYLDALATFSQAWNDLYSAVQDLEGVQVVAPTAGPRKTMAKPGVMVIVMPPPSTFTHKKTGAK
jgi:hypothetical protein